MKRMKLALVIILMMLLGIFLQVSVAGESTLVPLTRNGSYVYHYLTSEKVMIPSTYEEKDTEFRGVWVATVYNLNIPVYTSETQYKAEFQHLISEMLESNMNAMLFQVRPLNDAFYDSDFAPWSRYLTGSEGVDPGWDILAWMIEECHASGIEFHAWMNPYRVANTLDSKETYIASLSSENFAKQRPDLVVVGNVDSNGRNPLILNPGEPEVKAYIRNVVSELITNYDVDGIHFDDYFYPYSGISSDTATYNTYKLPGQTIADWRRENVNDVVRGVKEDIDAYNNASGESVRFGISPFGLWGSGIEGYSQTLEGGSNTAPANMSSYLAQYADSKKWVEEGWVHYICPQVYFSFTHSTAPYADVVDWWASIARGTGVDVYIGHSLSGADSGGWVSTEIADQLRYNLQHPEIKGEVMYSFAYLDKTHMQTVESLNWTVTPLNIYEAVPSDITYSLSGNVAGNIYTTDVEVTLTGSNDVYYKLDDGQWTLYTTPFMVTGSGAHAVYTKSVDSEGVESAISSFNIAIQYLNTDVPSISIDGNKIASSYILGSKIVLSSAGEDIYVAINHGSIGTFELYTGPIELNDTGTYYIRAKTIDSRGTESEETILSISVTEECYLLPSISLQGTGTEGNYQSVTVTLTGVTAMQYKLNAGTWIDYTGPFTITEEGNYVLSYRNNDACLSEQSTSFVVDSTPPEGIDINAVGDYDGERYYTSVTTVTLSTTDQDSTIWYRLHNGTSWSVWKVYAEPIELIYSATFTIEYKLVDKAQNESEVYSSRFRLSIAPTETNVYVIRDGEIVTYYNSDTPIELPEYSPKSEEIHAVWVATVGNIDLSLMTSEEAYKNEIIQMLDKIESYHFNTIFFQVRPMNDAFYDSDYAPWSRYITGTEGVDPGFDVLQFIIDESHKRGIELHAWLNPYRVSTGTSSKEEQLALLASDNFAKQNPDLVMQDSAGHLILNPGERQVQVYIRGVIQELITKYNVDGIHFDDYFYSYSGTPLEADADLYARLKDPNQTLDDWRRENINTVVMEVHNLIDGYNLDHQTTIRFGISPFGIWESGGTYGSNTSLYTLSSYQDQYADSRKWVMEGWVDYILPQLYWQFDHSSAPFADLVDWWADLCDTYN
ncbi:MAG: family 10 glycosylhydrolase, partial [Candidatus Izemoplasmatales bacterium]